MKNLKKRHLKLVTSDNPEIPGPAAAILNNKLKEALDQIEMQEIRNKLKKLKPVIPNI